MKKAVVIGGASGIGLAISRNLVEKGYQVTVLDIKEPDAALLSPENTIYRYCNMLYPCDELMAELAADPEVQVLMITAGIGRVAELEYLGATEIANLMQINAVSAIKAIRLFYDRIHSENDFYCGIMGSIAGLVSSPMFSAYAASKAAVCRFCESVNIELEAGGYRNRICCVSPGFIAGTGLYGGKNDLTQTAPVAEEIVSRLFSRAVEYIPKYEETYQGVIERYRADAHKFGMESYEYKKNSGRTSAQKGCRIGYLSGTFDLFHIGHLNLLRRAKAMCDHLIVGVHPDASHKGKEVFIPLEERKEILRSVRYVDQVVDSCREDSDAWDLWHYSRLFVGSDYKGTERFLRYEEYFRDKGVEIVYFPYTQGTSSTQLRRAVQDRGENK